MESHAAVFREVGAPVAIERIALDPPGARFRVDPEGALAGAR
jgi:hypothetical protein